MLKQYATFEIRIYLPRKIFSKAERNMLPRSGFAYHKKIITAEIRMFLPGEIFAKGKRSKYPDTDSTLLL
jgi:hypothetical protein